MNSTNPHRLWVANEEMIPRLIEAGDLTLDLLHRDARVEDSWVHLHPREFELLWHLAQSPGQRMSRRQLLSDVWRLEREPGTNSLAVHIARVRAKLDKFGLGRMVVTHPDGGYYLDAPPGPSQFRFRGASR